MCVTILNSKIGWWFFPLTIGICTLSESLALNFDYVQEPIFQIGWHCLKELKFDFFFFFLTVKWYIIVIVCFFGSGERSARSLIFLAKFTPWIEKKKKHKRKMDLQPESQKYSFTEISFWTFIRIIHCYVTQ